MKSPIFKLILAVITMLASSHTANAGNGLKRDSLPEGVTRYDMRIERYRALHSRLIPRYTKIQFAGSIGMLSGGVGWDYGKGRRWETDILVGFVPRFESNRAKLTFTLRENIRPWRIAVGTSPIDFHPLRASLGMNAIIGHEFWTSNPERYPDGYYFFSTKFHVVASFGQQWTLNIPVDKRMNQWRAIGFFYDLSTTETYLLSGFGNKYICFKDMFHLSIGLKLQIL